tara:strand:+ start:506 stop:922 length:417 start_codon:yes stop_codon:yes gene_type:complete
MDLLDQLKRPFPVSSLKWRKGGGGKELVYADARAYQKMLDDVMGAHWQCEYTHVTHTGLTACKVGLLIDGEWVWRSSGAGETNIEGDKGTFTDSFKRACAAWGVGRYLYYGDIKDGAIPAWATPEGYDEIINKRESVE